MAPTLWILGVQEVIKTGEPKEALCPSRLFPPFIFTPAFCFDSSCRGRLPSIYLHMHSRAWKWRRRRRHRGRDAPPARSQQSIACACLPCRYGRATISYSPRALRNSFSHLRRRGYIAMRFREGVRYPLLRLQSPSDVAVDRTVRCSHPSRDVLYPPISGRVIAMCGQRPLAAIAIAESWNGTVGKRFPGEFTRVVLFDLTFFFFVLFLLRLLDLDGYSQPTQRARWH